MTKVFLVHLVIYILVYPFLLLISIIPFPLLYAFSDVVYVVVYHVIGYRKKTVTQNLKLVFPEKTEQEISNIRKKFYVHLCDMFIEMIKTMSIFKHQLNKRFIIKNSEVLKQIEALNKSSIVMYGHYASYEWSVVVENYTNFKGYGIYKRIENKYFDNLIRRIRAKYNTTLIPTREAFTRMARIKTSNEKAVIAFVSDQSPKAKKALHWSEFLGIKVPCYTGAEMMAKKFDFSVSYLKINKVKRGYYEAEFILLADDPNKYNNYEITDKFTSALEEQIYAAPEYYLWTHKRWKHRNKIPKEFQ